jgi:nitrogen fixation protein FixH
MRAGPSSLAEERQSRWIPWAFVAFFGVVFLANGAMIVVAMVTWPGLETKSAYQRGLDYNRTIAAAADQAKLGWQVDFGFEQDGDRRGTVRLDLADRFGSLLQRAEVEAAFVRPTHAGDDMVIEVPHEYGGRYARQIELPLAGQWEVRLTIADGGQEYRLRDRIYVAP